MERRLRGSSVAYVARNHRGDVQFFGPRQQWHLFGIAMGVQIARVPAQGIHIAESRDVQVEAASPLVRSSAFSTPRNSAPFSARTVYWPSGRLTNHRASI